MKNYFDLPGDGGSEVAAQVAEQRRAVKGRLKHLSQFVAIGSGKGGVGKSTVTRLIALELKRRGRRPAVLDVDFNGPGQACLSGLTQVVPVPGRLGLTVPTDSVGVGVLSLGSLVPETESVEFESVVEGESFTWRSIREFSALSDLLASTDWSPFDVLLLDLPPGAERTFQLAEFLGPDCGLILVSLPSALSLSVVARAAAALSRLPNPVFGYVENMNGYWCGDCRKVQPLFQSHPETELALPRLARLPFVASMGDARGVLNRVPEVLQEAIDTLCGNLLADCKPDRAGDRS